MASPPIHEVAGAEMLGADRFELRAPGAARAREAEPTGPSDFSSLFADAVRDADQLGHVADRKAGDFAVGLADDLHGTMLAVKEAEISLQLVSTVRNKLLDAFHELWRINV